MWDPEFLHDAGGGRNLVGVSDENDGAHARAFHNRRDRGAQNMKVCAMREMRADNNHLLAIIYALKLLNDERTVAGLGGHAAPS